MKAGKALTPAAGAEPEPRGRYDGFTPAKRRRCLEAIGDGHCVAEACFRVRISTTTFYRHKNRFPAFRRELETAQARAELPLENIAWLRATVGAEEKTYRDGKLVQVRIKPSDAMLRLLLQASNPKKYGRLSRGGATRKQIEKQLRAEITREVRAELTPRVATNAQVREALVKRLKVFGDRVRAKQHRPPEAPDAPAGGEAPEAEE